MTASPKNNRESYTNAGTYPSKLLGYVSEIVNHGVFPVHASVIPTNQCNLKCDFCSCRNESRLEYFEDKDYKNVLEWLVPSVEAITITGGGEPLLEYFDLIRFTKACYKKVKLGLVTNGTIADHDGYPSYRDPEFWNRFEWIRISMDSKRKNIPSLPYEHPGLAYSYVYRDGDETDSKLIQLIEKASRGDITHLRIVSDILNDGAGKALEMVRRSRLKYATEIPNVIFQPRHNYKRGAKKCYMHLIKPVVTPTGIYTCCGAQYAIKGKEGKMPEELLVAENLKEYENEVLEPQWIFDGSICNKCYYWGYNELIDMAVQAQDIRFKEFV
jgi:organic radical activating enzyme